MKGNLKPNQLTIAIILAAGVSVSAVAAPALEEVIVTAQKREQSLQETPISISAFDAGAIENQGIKDIGDVSQYTPNVQIAESPGGSTGATIAIRGSVTVNPVVTIDTNVGVYMDGVYIAKNVGGLFDVAELERIEILRGPQGTLYGKNTVGGAVNLVASKPSEEFGGNVRLGAGNYNYTDVYASIDTGTFGEKFKLNLAVSKRERDGFYDNVSEFRLVDEFKKLDSLAARVAFQIDATDNFGIYYTYDMNERDNTPSMGQFEISGLPTKRNDQGKSDGAYKDTSDSSGHALHLDYAINDTMTLKSITAYREMNFADVNDYDGGDYQGFLLHAGRDAEQKQLSQEFQLIGQGDSINYVVGLFYFDEEVDVYNPLAQQIDQFFVPYNVRNNLYGADSTSYAAYGQADWAINEQWVLTVGARWTDEEKEGYVDHPDDFWYDPTQAYYAETEDSWKNLSPMAVLTYNINDEVNTYIKYSEGWKSGGFNAEAPNEEAAERSYDEETVQSFELGLKSRFMDSRLQINAALFRNNIKDLQLSQVDPNTFYSEIFNAGESTINGAELEVLFAMTESLTANINYGYLDAEYDEFIAYGIDIKDEAQFPYTPDNTASIGLEYAQDLSFGELSARLDWSHIDDHVAYHDAAQAEVTKIDAYSLVNARITLGAISLGSSDTSLKFALWGKNLSDEEYRINGIPLGGPTAVNYYGNPRTYGAEVTLDF
ncbi:MAG: TonB-dependent receptor [Pseudomonadales bacterium]